MTTPEYVTFHGGPMDGYRMPVHTWTPQQRATGVAHVCEYGSFGPGGRVCYGPPTGNPLAPVWQYEGDIP